MRFTNVSVTLPSGYPCRYSQKVRIVQRIWEGSVRRTTGLRVSVLRRRSMLDVLCRDVDLRWQGVLPPSQKRLPMASISHVVACEVG